MVSFLANLGTAILQFLSTLVDFISFIIKLPNLLINIFLYFPMFIKVGFTIIFTFLVIMVLVRLKHYLV